MARKGQYPGPGGMLALSFLCHALVLVLVLKLQLLPHAATVETPSYYVDLVNLPVASPQAGTPGPPAAAPAGPSAPEEPASAPVMPAKLPVPQPKSKPLPATVPAKPAAKPKPEAAHDDNHDFNERMAKLAQAAEERRYNETLAKLKKGGGGKVGVPGGKGTEAGSDYSSYIQSRLRDAFRSTIASDTSAPRVAVRLTIGPDGRIVRLRIEQTSGDRVFEEAVERAVHLAEKSFRPPPSGGEFEQGFVFRPQGVGVR
ncbi:TonB C-terminal domain-containing protein [Geomonas sp. RF6]|uniref:energy transducer TonB n=1 Tax=Geomonas sp. RF6 TaxID=2897342 RepID=UPI001E5F7428|nr:energy transducer TonB [Geomonas sp. RF6]UFS71819.1 TonB C-terminal domain-containing protein [Geomonas sp. RF6]